MPLLRGEPTLVHLQSYVSDLEKERGFETQDAVDKCLLLGEELGELFKAVRKQEGMGVDRISKVGSIGEELADMLIYLCAIANRFEISLEAAFREKEERNKNRTWEK
jgi:NTP pyrophosphatase (non-canonical NTP hydrolase)